MWLDQTICNEVDVVMLSGSWKYMLALHSRICRPLLFS